MTTENTDKTAPMGPFCCIRLLVAYEGSGFHGFAYQGKELPTVARSLRRALANLVGYEPELTVAGRTDAGVHAWGQVVSFQMPQAARARFDLERISKSLNKQLPPSIVVREVTDEALGFSARFSATGRSYRYTVRNAELPSPFDQHIAWHVKQPLDVDAMNLAAKALVGEHDFSSFCRRPAQLPGVDEEVSLVRRLTSAQWVRINEDTLRFDVSANAFCHQQVRSMVGMLVAIGRQQRPVAAMADALDARDRSSAATLAPPQGLCLWEVQY